MPWVTLARSVGGATQEPVDIKDKEELNKWSYVKKMDPHDWKTTGRLETPWGPPVSANKLKVPPLLSLLEYSPPLIHGGELHYGVEGWRPARRLKERLDRRLLEPAPRDDLVSDLRFRLGSGAASARR